MLGKSAELNDDEVHKVQFPAVLPPFRFEVLSDGQGRDQQSISEEDEGPYLEGEFQDVDVGGLRQWRGRGRRI